MADWARQRFAESAVARLATVTPDGRPHLVPVVFAIEGDQLWTAVDDKPKSTSLLQRLANIRSNPRVSLLVDQYDDDWSALWWVRVDGLAAVLESGSAQEARGIEELARKYPQYEMEPPRGPVLSVEVDTWRQWAARRPADGA